MNLSRRLVVLSLTIHVCLPALLHAQVEDYLTGLQINQLTLQDGNLYWKSDCTRPELSQTRINRRPLEGRYAQIVYNRSVCSTATSLLTKMALDSTHAYWVESDGDVMRMQLDGTGLATDVTDVNSAIGISPNGEVAVSANYVFWTEEQGEFRDRSAIFRAPKTPGGSFTFVISYANENNALVIAMKAINDSRIIYLLSDGRLIETSRVGMGTPPLIFYTWQETDTISTSATALRVLGDRLWWADRSSDGRSTYFRSAPLSNLSSVTLHHLAFRNSSHEVKEFVADGANLFYQDLTTGTTGPFMRKSLTDASAEVEIASLLYPVNDMVLTDRHVLWRKNFNTVSRLPINAAAVTRDLSATGLEVVQVIQNSGNENPLVMGKPTFVRAFGQITSSSAGETSLDFWPAAYLYGEKNGVPLPGSPLGPYKTAPLINTPSFRTTVDHGFWFRLPDAWTRLGEIRLRSVINPLRILSETSFGNNSRSVDVDFIRQAAICMVMKPTLTHQGAIYEYNPSMQATFDYIEALLPVSELRVVWGGGLIEEPYDPLHWVGDGGPFEVTDADDDGSAMLTELNTRKVFTTRRYCEPLSGYGFDHYVAMLKPQADAAWGGLARRGDDGINLTVAPSAFFNHQWTNSLGVPGGAATQCQELAHNYGRQHVNCGDPKGIDTSYPYATNTLYSPGIDYIGFNPFTRQIILPGDARDYMSYCGPEWTSDYTWRSLVNLIGDIPPGAGGGGGSSKDASEVGNGGGTGGEAPARVVLAVDFNDRAGASVTYPGFDPFVIGTANGTGIQTTQSVQHYDGLTVTLRGVGSETGYDDRVRATPENSGSFNESLLLRDFVFSRDGEGIGGLDIVLNGLLPNHTYRVKLWSFDSVSIGSRVADWFANFVQVSPNYTFDGRVLPTSNEQYQMSFSGTTEGTGTLVISGRRDSTSVSETGLPSFGVFINALQVLDPVTPPTGSSYLAGFIDAHDGRAAFKQVLPISSPAELAAVQALVGGQAASPAYQIKAFKAGQVSATYPVYVNDAPTDEGAEEDILFLAVGDIENSVDRLEFVDVANGNVPIGEIVGGGLAPTVTVQTPAVGASLPRSSPFTISYTGQDPENNPLVYTVRFSPDGGANWQVLASSTPAVSIPMKTSGLPGSTNCFIQVIASDGILTGSALTGPFTLEQSVPKVYAFVETSRGKNCGNLGRTFIRAGESVLFHGEAFDDEDGELDGESMSWNVNGPIHRSGSGRQFLVEDLPPGDYVVGLLANDTQKNSGTATLNLTVDPHFVEDAGQAIVVDGHPDDRGYLRDRQPLRIRYDNGEAALVRMVHNNGNLYVCASGLREGTDSVPRFGLMVDANQSGGSSPGVGDLKFEVFADGRARTLTGNGSSYVIDTTVNGLTAAVYSHDNYWTVELCINLSRFGGWNGQTVNLSVVHDHIDLSGETNRSWPIGTFWTNPSAYGSVVLGPDPHDPTDLDKDGLPDRYELEVFGGTKPTAADDTDGDGVSNGKELESGTDPDDPNSVFNIGIIYGQQGNLLYWTPRQDRSYNVLASKDLYYWEPVAFNISNGQWVFPPDEDEVFYKVEVCRER